MGKHEMLSDACLSMHLKIVASFDGGSKKGLLHCVTHFCKIPRFLMGFAMSARG